MSLKYFGTDGVRGLYGEKLTPKLAYRIGRYLGQPEGEHRKRILLGRDTRASGDVLASALATGMMVSGADVYDAAVTTTPSISYLVKENLFDYGVMISASHNPYYDNGIKVFAVSGEKIDAELEARIETYIDGPDDLPCASNEEMGRFFYAQYLVDSYKDFLYTKGKALGTNLRIAVDCANGSASYIAPKLFNQLGIRTSFIHNDPDGVNINENCGSTNLASLKEKMQSRKYDLGIAFDGDADRVLLVDPNGNEIDGDAIIYLSALNMVKRGKLHNNKVALTVMSNLGVKNALKEAGIEIIETAVGDKYVHQALKEHHLSLGGEQSGHIIFSDDLNTGDGLLTALKVLKTMHFEKATINELIAGFKKLPQYLVNLDVKDKRIVMNDPEFNKYVRDVEQKLGSRGRVLVRASGTQEIVRVMAEAETEKLCHQIVDDVVKHIKENYL